MAEFCVNTAEVNSSANKIMGLKEPISSVGRNVASIGATTIFMGAGYLDVVANLEALALAVNRESVKTEQLGEALQRIYNLYIATEESIAGVGATGAGSGAAGGDGSGEGDNSALARLREIAGDILNHIQEGTNQLREWISNSPFISDIQREFLERVAEGRERYEDGMQTVNTIIDLFTGDVSLRDLHYNRNDNMPIANLPQSPEEAEAWGWDDGVAANCHQYTAPDGTVNTKWVSPDGHYEVIFDSNGNIVTASEDYGTYNYCDPNSHPIGHLIFDVVPWYIWGNAPDDSTSVMDRVFLSLNLGTADEVRASVQSAMDSGQSYVNSGIDNAQSSANSAIDELQSYVNNSTINDYIDAGQQRVNDVVDGAQDLANDIYDSAQGAIDSGLDWLNRWIG